MRSWVWSEHHEIEWAIKRIAALGLQGIEPYPQQIEKYRSDPLRLKKLFDEARITLIDVSNGAKGQSTNFIDRDQIPRTIADHVAFACDFVKLHFQTVAPNACLSTASAAGSCRRATSSRRCIGP